MGWEAFEGQNFILVRSGQALRGLHSEFSDGIYEFKIALWDLNTNVCVSQTLEDALQNGWLLCPASN